MNFRNVITVLAICLMIAGCAGRTPNPVLVQQYGDEKKSCKRLRTEISQINNEIQVLLPKSDKTAGNVALGVAGFFLLVPLFFMDFSDAEKIEVNALRKRHNHLVAIASEKNCGFEDKEIPAFEQKKEVEKDSETS